MKKNGKSSAAAAAASSDAKSGANATDSDAKSASGATATAAGSTGSVDPAYTFSVAQYNVLADCYTTDRHELKYVDANTLKWANRKKALIKQIVSLDADVLCLEEVDHYEDWWSEQLTENGYDSYFVSRIKGKEDGCAIAWRSDKFKSGATDSVAFTDDTKHIAIFAVLHPIPKKWTLTTYESDAKTDSAATDSTAVAAAAATATATANTSAPPTAAAPTPIIVACTHLDWASPVTRLAQTRQLRTAVTAFRSRQPGALASAPVICCGDFNAEPKTAVVAYMLSGEVKSAVAAQMAAKPAKKSGGGNSGGNAKKTKSGNAKSEPAAAPAPTGLQFISAFAGTHSGANNANGEPAMTIVKPTYTATIDYVFYTPRLCIERAAVTPVPAKLSKLPNAQHPSDHLPLRAVFKFVAKS